MFALKKMLHDHKRRMFKINDIQLKKIEAANADLVPTKFDQIQARPDPDHQ